MKKLVMILATGVALSAISSMSAQAAEKMTLYCSAQEDWWSIDGQGI